MLAGRNRYNAGVARRRDARRAKLLGLIMSGQVRPEQHSKIMDLLGVASVTAWRDKVAVMEQIQKDNVCPTCGRAYVDHLMLDEALGPV